MVNKYGVPSEINGKYNPEYEKARYQANRAQKLYSSKIHYLELRIRIIQHYSSTVIPSCNCCGTTIFEFLTIDHLKGGGTQHIKNIHAKGSRFYEWLEKNSYPEGYQVLCMNCNWAKDRWKICPCKKGDGL